MLERSYVKKKIMRGLCSGNWQAFWASSGCCHGKFVPQDTGTELTGADVAWPRSGTRKISMADVRISRNETLRSVTNSRQPAAAIRATSARSTYLRFGAWNSRRTGWECVSLTKSMPICYEKLKYGVFNGVYLHWDGSAIPRMSRRAFR